MSCTSDPRVDHLGAGERWGRMRAADEHREQEPGCKHKNMADERGDNNINEDMGNRLQLLPGQDWNVTQSNTQGHRPRNGLL